MLLTYRLSGTITDAAGSPVAGASVVTRTIDRDFWTFSQPSDSQGRYASFFTASDELGGDPVPLSVLVAVGTTSYGGPTGQEVSFKRLRSATLAIKLPATGTAFPAPTSSSLEGAIYDGLLVGVASGERTIRPLSATWPDRQGRFRLVLPASAHGKPVTFWMDDRQVFSRAAAAPGGSASPGLFPSSPRAQAPRGFLRLRLP